LQIQLKPRRGWAGERPQQLYMQKLVLHEGTHRGERDRDLLQYYQYEGAATLI
jgi:hypothetical protein